MTDEPLEATILDIDVEGKENIDFVMSVLQSQDMKELCGKLLVPALGKISHDTMIGGKDVFDFHSGRYDMLAEIISLISD
jgi:hypothetical protein